MPEFHFADGFDVSEPLALGLSPAQLVVGVLGLLVDYADLGSSLHRAIAVPIAVLVTAITLALALGRRDGHPLIEWAGVALRFAVRPKHGRFHTEMNVITAAITMPRPTAFVPAPPAGPEPVRRPGAERHRRVPLMLLPTPVSGPPRTSSGDVVEIDAVPALKQAPDPGATTGCLEVADAPVADPLRGVGTTPGQAATGLMSSASLVAPPPTALPIPAAEVPPCVAAPPWPPVFAGATRRLTFFSLSGGVGRTTLAVEVAALLAGRGRHWDPLSGSSRPLRVALIDLDGRSPCVGLRLGIAEPSVADWLLDGASPSRLDQHLVRHRSGLQAMVGSARPSGPTPTPEQVGAVVEALERQGSHFVVCDIGAGLSPVNEWVLQNVHDIFVTITPTTRGLQDAYRSTELLRRMGLRHKLHYVVNRDRGEVDLAETMGDLGGRVDAEIADDDAVGVAENQHRLLGLDGEGAAAGCLRKLAAAVYPAIDDSAGPAAPPAAEAGWRRFSRGRRRRAG